MGEYLSHMNLGGHRRGTVKVYDDDDAVLARRLAAGWVSPVGTPVGARPVDEAEKPAPRKRTAKKKAEPVEEPVLESAPEVKVQPEPESEPEVEGETLEEPEEQSSVQTSWFISPTQSEG